MRVVLIIQSIIILLGAYYVYTLTQEKSPENNESDSNITVEVRRESSDTVVDDRETDVVPESNTGGVIIQEGANDLGMEFPIPDDELEVR